tara:strand:+ start:313 stop:759 length:447 start_codon:yes stop_codon:yes gene_type:complete
MRENRVYISVSEAVKLGYPDLRGVEIDGKRFTRYSYNENTGHCSPKYQCRKLSNAIIKRNSKKKLEYMKRYKLFVGCAFCGYKKHYAALEFDHINPDTKLGTISQAYRGWGMKKIKDEIRKCQVLCANCHRVKTMEEKDYLHVRNEHT